MNTLPASENAQRLRLYDPLLTIPENAKKINMTTGGYITWMRTAGLNSHEQTKHIKDTRRLLIYQAGYCDTHGGQKAGITRQQFKNWRGDRPRNGRAGCPVCRGQR